MIWSPEAEQTQTDRQCLKQDGQDSLLTRAKWAEVTSECGNEQAADESQNREAVWAATPRDTKYSTNTERDTHTQGKENKHRSLAKSVPVCDYQWQRSVTGSCSLGVRSPVKAQSAPTASSLVFKLILARSEWSTFHFWWIISSIGHILDIVCFAQN